ncbi:reverse gyrase [Methanotorris igneus]|uniref:Reverse gyrase n=1 Tax=Methanotorris igneus (strain DSM 5666 / JCM 11834 / Kol 5) TaxID=880724 RepID=F6BC58_METIK|nr:reverse gyrase [Methanotorris igneus]AEF96139.1 Reverse gyrase [Methanotorris igneus Kol 5]
MVPIIFKNMCPNCHSDIESLRLDKGLTCKNCMEDDSVSNICKYLAEKNTLKALEDYCKLKNELKELEDVAERCGFKLLSIQRMWAKRVLKNKSFSIVAPTGVGKSVFGMITAIYFATKNKKSYIILPTTLLVKQTYEKIINMANKAGVEVNVVAYHSELSSEEKRVAKEKIEKKDYNILITTSNYLSKNPIDDKFDFVFIDDVDAFLKASKNIDKSLKLLGFSDEIIKKAYNILYLIRKKKIEDALKEREKLKEMISKINHGCMIVASATGKSYGDKVKLYRELLDFEIGYGMSKLRDVEDIYDENLSMEKILEYIKIFGDGGIIFVPIDYGLKKAEEIEEFLIKNGIKAKLIHSKDKKGFEEFKNGEIDVLIGVASYYGVLVRGLDIPERIRYCIFYGVPKFKIDLEETLKKENENISIEGLNEEELMELVKNTLKIKNFSLRKEDNKYYLLIPDVKTYIQTSGRTSRMTENGLIKGASIVLVDDAEVFEGLKKYMLFMYEGEFKRIDEIDVEKLIEKIDEDRRKLKETKEKNKVPDLLKSALMVVESPNKARTIANFFGKPSVRRINNKKVYEVCIGDWNLIITASGGHIFDLVTKEGYHGVLIGNNSYIPIYGTIKRVNGEQFVDEKNIEELIKRIKEKTNENIVIHDAKENIEILRDLASEVDAVFIATDIDVEGEKIGYDIYLNLKPFNKNIFRIGFNEITKRAIMNAIKIVKEGKSEELSLDENKVRAQVVRRIEDRWIGFELSKKLWDAFNNTYLSAGRVQTPVLGWIIDRYNEYQIKVPYLYLKLEDDISFGTIVDDETAKKIKDKDYVDVEVNVYEKDIYPNPPFTTDTLLEEATKRFGLSSDEVMKIAQELFELGLTTYHRTSSTRVSLDGMRVAREYLEFNDMLDYLKNREYYMEGAHECIRPTKPMDTSELIEFIKNNNIYLTKDHIKIYDLIFRRFIASQMKECKVEYEEITIKDLDTKVEGYTNIIYDGWTKIYNLKLRKLPKIEKNTLKIIEKSIRKVPKVSLYDEGEIIKLMKERGIGRPSTYAQIVKKLFDRKYVLKSKDKGKIIPTKLGIEVYNYLKNNYYNLICEERTRELENVMDKIEKGEVEYIKVLDELLNEIKSIT